MAKVHLFISFMVEHEGIIEKINDRRVIVRFTQQSACTSCHAKGVCSIADVKEKRIEITNITERFCERDEVTIVGKTSIGYRAVLWAFVLPLILVVLTLIVSLSYHIREIQAAIFALTSLLPYYLLLYLLRNKMACFFQFTIKRKSGNM